ncbi:MAG TPA: hypothetical protein PLZ43_14960 [bacterium]|nr:hypothetical protein [bacterium]
MKLFVIFLFLFFAVCGCGDNGGSDGSDQDTVESGDIDTVDAEIPDITSSIVFMDNFKAKDGGYGQMYNEGSLIGVSFYFWNGENNENTCKKEFLSPPEHHSYMYVEGLMEIKITINGFEKGEYKIVKYAESDFFSNDEKLATIKACLWHEEELQPGFEDCYVPYTGTVTIDKDVPQTVKESKDIEIAVKIDADFPEESIRLVDREGYGEEIDGEWVEYEVCNCRHDDGTNSQCTPSYKGENCCYNPDSKMVNYKMNYKTTVCNIYCSVTTESVSDMGKCEL